MILSYLKNSFRINKLLLFLLFFIVIFIAFPIIGSLSIPKTGSVLGIQSGIVRTTPFIASIDTMKDSRDSETWHLTGNEITNDAKISALFNTNYITIDTHWDYPDYMNQWISQVRATGKHIWFRSAPNKWEESNNVRGIMNPNELLVTEKAFILAHPSFFKSGDIFDPCPEPEQGHYWEAVYGKKWTWNAPNRATREYNAFIRNSTDTANASFAHLHIAGVITTIRSTNSFFPTHPLVFETKTVQKLGMITFDSYPEGTTLNPNTATKSRLDELNQIEKIWHVPLVIGELGYSNGINVDDFEQERVLNEEFQAISKLSFVQGLNYWVGAGTSQSGGYTHIYTKNAQGSWALRPAAIDLALYFKQMRNI